MQQNQKENSILPFLLNSMTIITNTLGLASVFDGDLVWIV